MKLALFDLDGTLIAGDSASLWVEYMYKLGWADDILLAKNNEFMNTYNRGNMNMQDYIELTTNAVVQQQLTVDEINVVVQQFIQEKIKPIIYPAGQQLVTDYLNNGYRVIVISATVEYLVKPIVKTLGIDEVIAIQLAAKDNYYTGKTQGILSYQDGKVTRLKQLLGATWQDDLKDAYFYSDSHNDIPLLEIAGNPVATNPNEKLISYAQEHAIKIVNWQI